MNGDKARIRALKAGKDWWGKRPLSNTPVSRRGGMKFWKRILHGIERAQGKKEIQNQLKDNNNE